jgi:lysozyme
MRDVFFGAYMIWKRIKSWFTRKRSTPSSPKAPTKSDPISKNGILGIDVSHHNGELNWAMIKKSGVDFVFIKASQGSSFKDRLFKKNVAGAKENGILVGAYHYFEPGITAEIQVENFLNCIKGLDLDLPSVLDWEERSDASREKQISRALKWLSAVEAETKKKPIIYTGPYYFSETVGNAPEFKQYPLWIAHYKTKTPKIPSPWEKCLIHQYTETGLLKYHSGMFDLNSLNGDLSDLIG